MNRPAGRLTNLDGMPVNVACVVTEKRHTLAREKTGYIPSAHLLYLYSSTVRRQFQQANTSRPAFNYPASGLSLSKLRKSTQRNLATKKKSTTLEKNFKRQTTKPLHLLSFTLSLPISHKKYVSDISTIEFAWPSIRTK